jgi:hypothetical protein
MSVSFKFVTNEAALFDYFFPDENCEAGAQLEGICLQTRLLYFLVFYHCIFLFFYHLSVVVLVVGCWC